jgi:predicted dehydrogenase
MIPKINRRSFVEKTGAVLAAGPLLVSQGAAALPNSTVNHAVIGTGGRGTQHVKKISRIPGARVVAVCDIDPELLDRAANIPQGNPVKKYKDFRKLLENSDIDSVSVCTPDHWHTPVAMAAILAGKHVFVEKPCSHNLREAELLVQCAQQHNKCVQHGTQRRSDPLEIAGVRALNEGVIGDVHTAKAINCQLRRKIGKATPESAPPGVDYDLWLGAAPVRPFTRNRWHYNWHWFWDFGGGDLVNDGIHQVDHAIWGMGLDLKYPDSIITSGRQLWYDDDHETPDTQTIIYEYGSKQVIYEMRLWTPYKMEGHDNGTVWYGTKGKLESGRAGVVVSVEGRTWNIKPGDYGSSPETSSSFEGTIFENFFTSVRNNNHKLLRSPIETGAVTTNLCHLGNIGTRCGGGKLIFDPAQSKITYAGEHLDLANQLLTREYRSGYELPYTG